MTAEQKALREVVELLEALKALIAFPEFIAQACEGVDSEDARRLAHNALVKDFMQHFVADLEYRIAMRAGERLRKEDAKREARLRERGLR